jgi:hypothetical protein
LLSYPPRHLAFHSADVRQSALAHSKLYGSGPFFVFDNLGATVSRQGKELRANYHAAFGYWGNILIEFVQLESTSDPFLKQLHTAPDGRPFFHHAGLVVEDLDQTVQHFSSAGFEEIVRLRFEMTGAVIALVDTRPFVGHLTEIHVNNPLLAGLEKMIVDATADFDGSDPVRTISL